MSGYDYVSSSFDPLPDDVRRGMISMGFFGLVSSISTLSLLIFITYRMVYWRRYYDEPIAKNQIFILIYNLLLADFQQALSFLISFYWISQNKLVGPSPACFAQGWLIQIGDMSSGLWVLAIAVHTFVSLVGQKVVPLRTFVAAVVSLWMFCLTLTAIGPIMVRRDFFVPAGAWCWINADRQDERLYLHYLWIFISQLGSLVIYISIFFSLRTRMAGSRLFQNSARAAASKNNTTSEEFSKSGAGTTTTIMSTRNDAFAVSRKRILRTARYMVVYPFAYVALTLPLASGRVSAMAGKEPPLAFFPAAGTLMACCGITDVLLYIWTRKALLKSSVAKPSSSSEDGLTRRATLEARRKSMGGDVRMSRLTKASPTIPHLSTFNLAKGGIVVSKSVTTTRDESWLGFDKEEGNGSDRSDSLQSLVVRDNFST